jgi:hypothetical protein
MIAPWEVLDRFKAAPTWKRWLGVGVFLGAFLVSVVAYIIFRETSQEMSPGASGEATATAIGDDQQAMAEAAAAELSEINTELEQQREATEVAAGAAVEAAERAMDDHARINAAVDGAAVDAVLYGNRGRD